MRSVTVLLVGQIRNQHVLLRSVESLVALRDNGLVNRVILATWTEEVGKIRHLLPRLAAAGVTVTSADQPDAKLHVPGNLMHQMRAIDLALETVEDTDWVLRARPDMLIEYEMVASLAAADMALAESGPAPALQHKIWTPFVELCQPMCISDITFFGRYCDIVKLQNFDFFHEVANTHLGAGPGGKPITSYDAEVRRYTPAFLDAYPILSEYYRIYNKFFLGVLELRRSMLAMIYKEEFYWQYMSVYRDILKKYFLIGRDVVTTPVSLVRPQDFDQTDGLPCLDLLACGYAGKVLAQEPNAASTIELFAAAPIYCSGSVEAQSVFAHLERIGVPLARRLEDAVSYRKDAARIVALQAFREGLVRAIFGGVERGRTRISEWERPFSTQFVNLPGIEAPR